MILAILSLACTPVKQYAPPAENREDNLLACLEEQLSCYPVSMVASGGQNVSITDENVFIATFYHTKGLKPVWVTKEGPDKTAAAAYHFISGAEEEGLFPENYDLAKMSSLMKEKEPSCLAELDILITLNLAKYIHDVSIGRMGRMDAELYSSDSAPVPGFSPIEEIEKVLASKDAASYLSEIVPSGHDYSGLKKELKRYREIEKNGGWNPIPAGKKIKPGDKDERIPLIIRRLEKTGELVSDSEALSSSNYDPKLEKAVMKFQERHGLEPDGVLGQKTFEVMNIPVSYEIKQIILNMDRARRWNRKQDGKYVIVNIAGFSLSAFDNGAEVLNFPVVVGKNQTQTPLLSSQIRQVDFFPFWNVTPNIARNEELPKLRKNPYYFEKKRMRVYSGWGPGAVEIDPRTVDWNNVNLSRFRVRQDPGPWNALGKIKFVFPNKYDVYMHDTPSKNLFSRTGRGFSHGCIRVSKPVDLAEFVLADSGGKWTREKIEKVLEKGKRQVVSLDLPVPVYITYQTSWVDKNGIIYFNRDIYNRDKKDMDVLFSGGNKAK